MENTNDSTAKSPKRGSYYKDYYNKNREKRLAAVHASREKHLEEVRARDAAAKRGKPRPPGYAKERARKMRRELLNLLGGKCALCGFDDWRGLQIDHVNGGGGKERQQSRAMTKLRRDIKEHGAAKYQILCANCHQITGYERKQVDTNTT